MHRQAVLKLVLMFVVSLDVFVKVLFFFVAFSGVYGIIATMKKKIDKPRFLIPWNVGERVEKPAKGKGSFLRKEKHKKRFDN